MIATPYASSMSVEEYLDWEPQQEIRYEYINGVVYGMTGGTIPHNDIAINLLTALLPQVRAQGCRLNMAERKANQSSGVLTLLFSVFLAKK